MAQVAWISTGDARRAIEWAIETWDPVLGDTTRIVLAPRTGLADELVQELVARLRHRSSCPITMLVARDSDRERPLRHLSERLGIELRAAESFGDDEVFEFAPGVRAPRWLEDAFIVDIARGELNGPRPDAWFLSGCARLLRAESGALADPEALRLFRPQLLIWDAIGARWPGARRASEFLAVSDHRLALERTAHAIYRAFEARGGWTASEVRDLPAIRQAILSGEDLGGALELQTEGRAAQQLRRSVEAELGA